MLRLRVVTAIVLLAILLPALASSHPLPFAVVTLALIGAGAWEWTRLNGVAPAGALSAGVSLAAGGAIWLWVMADTSPAPIVWWASALTWVLGGAWALRVGPQAWHGAPVTLRVALGLGVLAMAWLAMVGARAQGLNFILSVFCLVWVADIAAYAGGRLFKGPKLAPTISPGKTWSGALCGVVGVFALAGLWVFVERGWPEVEPSLFARLLRDGYAVAGVLALALLAAMSVVGDLVESLVKRAAGVKDSSGLLPGHGGVLDRVDALLPVFPVALALVSGWAR